MLKWAAQDACRPLYGRTAHLRNTTKARGKDVVKNGLLLIGKRYKHCGNTDSANGSGTWREFRFQSFAQEFEGLTGT